MSVKRRIQILESHIDTIEEVLTPDQRKRLNELELSRTNNDTLEYLDLYTKSRPGLTFEQLLRESVGTPL